MVKLLISYPKAGRTWVRMMLVHYAGEEVVQTAHWLPKEAAKKMDLKEAEIIYLMRDPRDMVVSLYFEWTRRKQKYRGALTDFIREEKVGIVAAITHYNKWHAYRKSVKSFHEIWYEGIAYRPEASLAQMLQWLDKPVDVILVRYVVAACKFNEMKKMEKEGGGKLAEFKGHFGKHWKEEDPESFRVRKGKIGGYRDYMLPEDIRYCNKKMDWLCTNSWKRQSR